MKFQQQRGSKSRSSSHRGGGGQERRERRREEIRSQLYPAPATAEDQRGGEPHLLYRQHHRSNGIENGGPAHSGDGNHFHHHHDYRNGFFEEPMNGRVPHHHPASFSQGAVSGAPFHDMPARYTEQLKPQSQPLAMHSQGLEQQQQPLIQATEPSLSSAVGASTVTKTAEAKGSTAAAGGERDPPALQEKNGEVKRVKDSSVTDKKEEIQSKPHPQDSVSEKPLQERKEVTEIVKKDKKEGEHTGPLDEEPTTKPHPPVAKTETSVEKEPVPSLPSKSDLNNEAESLASVIPSSDQISDPLALLSSSSLPKLPPLKKSLPPLLPPIAATAASALEGQSAKKTEQPETKLLENAALSSEREVKGDKQGSDKGEGASGSSSAGAADTLGGSREGGGEVKVKSKEEGDGSSAIAAATHIGIESPDVGKGSLKEQVRNAVGQQVTDQKGGGGESSDGTTESQELKTKDGSLAAATKVGASGSDKHLDGQQNQVESQESHQGEASPAKKKEKVNDEEEVKDKKQTDHLDRGGGEGGGEGEGERPGGKGEEEGKATEGERKGKKATASPPMSVVTPPPRQPRNLKV